MTRLPDSPSRLAGLAMAKLQAGVVLMITLIALVTLALAALALIRSVDTNIIIAGNVSLKQAATLTADNGVETAIDWMAKQAASDFDEDHTDVAYYATSVDNPLEWNKDEWEDLPAKAAEGEGIDANGVDQGRNRILYVIQRMCSETGPPDEKKCLIVQGSSEGEGQHVQGGPKLDKAGLLSPLYRITARVDGPRNTVSYVQAFVF